MAVVQNFPCPNCCGPGCRVCNGVGCIIVPAVWEYTLVGTVCPGNPINKTYNLVSTFTEDQIPPNCTWTDSDPSPIPFGDKSSLTIKQIQPPNLVNPTGYGFSLAVLDALGPSVIYRSTDLNPFDCNGSNILTLFVPPTFCHNYPPTITIKPKITDTYRSCDCCLGKGEPDLLHLTITNSIGSCPVPTGTVVQLIINRDGAWVGLVNGNVPGIGAVQMNFVFACQKTPVPGGLVLTTTVIQGVNQVGFGQQIINQTIPGNSCRPLFLAVSQIIQNGLFVCNAGAIITF